MKRYTERVCSTCKNPFNHWHYEAKYCSKKCTNKAYYDRHKDYQLDKNTHLKKAYGISLEYYKQLYKEQQGVCAICKEPETQIHKKTGQIMSLSVDHCHTTGNIRGLLCKKCNMALGLFQDNELLLKEASVYLKTTQVKAMRGAQ